MEYEIIFVCNNRSETYFAYGVNECVETMIAIINDNKGKLYAFDVRKNIKRNCTFENVTAKMLHRVCNELHKRNK